MAKRRGVTLGPETEDAVADYLLRIEEGPVVAPEPGWQQTPEGIEYTVPAQGAEKEERDVELELVP